MYREIGQHDKAIANFEKASKIDPKHVQSLLDLGILYAQDVKDVDKARKSWQRVLSVAPASRQAERARQYIEQLEQAPKPK
jgi:tetratricopeptide (TPR) repeat protein